MADEAYLDTLTPDELRARLSVIHAEKKRQADLATYQAVANAKDTAAVPMAAASNVAALSKDRALQGVDIPDLVKSMNQSMAVPSPDEMARLNTLEEANAAGSFAQPGADLSKDIEGALKLPGAHETIANDQRLVVGPEGQPLATRDEYPPVAQHLASLVHGEPNAAAVVAGLGNVLESTTRTTGTGVNYALKALFDKQQPDWTNLPRDLGAAAAGTSGHGTVAEGGLVAHRGGGFGDVLRLRAQQLKDAGPIGDNSTTWSDPAKMLGPAIAGLVGLPLGIPGLLAGQIGARSEMAATGPQHEPNIGDAIGQLGLPSEYVDPYLNAYGEVKHGAQMLHAGGVNALQGMGPIAQSLAALSKVTPLGPLFDSVKTDVAPEIAAPDSVEKIKADLAGEYGTGNKLPAPDANAYDAYGQAMSTLYDPLNVAGPEHLLAAAEHLGVPGAKTLGRVASYDLTKLFSRENALKSGLYKDAIKAGATPEEALADAEKMSTGIYDQAQQAHAEAQGENNVQQQLLHEARSGANKADVPNISSLLEDRAAGFTSKPDVAQMLDIQAAAKAIHYSGLSDAEKALIDAIPAGLAQDHSLMSKVPRETFFRRQRLADKLGVDLTHPHPWASSTNMAERRALVSAKFIRRATARTLEEDQLRGLLPGHLRPDFYMPHTPRWAPAAKMEAAGVPKPLVNAIERVTEPFVSKPPYNPRRAREMAAMGDTEVLRRASIVVNENAHRTGQPVSQLLNDFATKPALQADRNVVNQVRQELMQAHNVPVWSPTGTVDEANRLAANKGARGRGRHVSEEVRFNTDPVINAAAHRTQAGVAQHAAAFGEGVSRMTDRLSQPMAQPLMEAITNPRHGGTDGMLLHKLASDPNGPHAALFQNGKLIPDVGGYLDRKGLTFISAEEAKRMGMEALGNSVVPRAVYHDLVDVAPKLRVGPVDKALQVMAKATNIWAPIVLNTPGFHIRNALFGQFQVYLAVGGDITDAALWHSAGLVASAAEKGGLAHGTIRYLGKDYKIANLVEEAKRLGVFEGGRAADLEGAIRRGVSPYNDQWIGDKLRRLSPLNDRGILGAIPGAAKRFPVLNEPIAKIVAGRGTGAALGLKVAGAATSENVQRMMIFLHGKMKMGLASREAAQNVVKYMFDYTGAHLSQGEKVARRFVPFYQWVKQSLLLTVDQVLKNPRRYALVNHLFETMNAFNTSSNQDPRLVPAFLGERGAVAAPFTEDTPQSRTLMSLERPGTQASWLLDPLLRHDPNAIGSALAQQLHPLAGMGIEAITGKYNFGDRPLSNIGYDPNMQTGFWERLLKQHNSETPGYLGRKFLGGYAGLGVEPALSAIDPELGQSNPRFTGLDAAKHNADKALSMLLGPQVSTTSPQTLAKQQTQALGTTEKNVHSQQQRRAGMGLGQ